MTAREQATANMMAFAQTVVSQVANAAGVSPVVLCSGGRLTHKAAQARRVCAVKLHATGMSSTTIAKILNVRGRTTVCGWFRAEREAAL